MRRFLACALALMLLIPGAAPAEEPVYFVQDAEADCFGTMVVSYDTHTLKYTIESFLTNGERCYLTRIWMKDPAKQIRKATGKWRKGLEFPKTMASMLPEAALLINGSGYVSPQFPEIPDNYPGESRDYFYTPLGSLTVTNGEVFRDLEGVPFYGLILNDEGLQMITGEDNKAVLAMNPIQTWSFYTTCPMLRNNEDLLPEEWIFADRRAARTCIARLDRNNYLLFSVREDTKGGISLRRAQAFFRENFPGAEWVYNLDGGPSSALLCREQGKKKVRTIMGGGAKDADCMAFTELKDE